MAGLDPTIHVFEQSKEVVDARHKAGRDEERAYRPALNLCTSSGVG
jgi:hypothetical protein